METKMKNVKITTIILAIILITLVAFMGVYMKNQNRMENKVKDYALGRELKGGRVIELKVSAGDKETEVNQENLTVENYEIVKNTIDERLKNIGAQDYEVSLNKENGTIQVELAEDNNTDTYAYFLTADSKVQIKEKDAKTELLSDSMIKKALYTYNADMEGAYTVYLELQLTDEGQAKIQEIQNNYAIFADEVKEIEAAQAEKEKTSEAKDSVEGQDVTEATTEKNSEEENAEQTKKIAVLTIAGTEYEIEKIEKDKIKIIIGAKTTNTTNINNSMAAAAELSILINSGKYPVQYKIEDNRFIHSDITNEQILYLVMVVAIVILVLCIILIIKYKTKGLLVCISYIGFVAILSLLLRYTNVNISIEGIAGIILILIINFIINQIILSKTKTINLVDEAIVSTYKEVFLKLVPIIIISLVFCFAKWANLSSFGMIMFWGLLLIATYNIIVTETLLKLKESK